MRTIYTAAAALIIGTGVAAQDCKRVIDNDARLACYDEKFPPIRRYTPDEDVTVSTPEVPDISQVVEAPQEPMEEVVSTGKWNTQFDQSAFDDSRSVYLSVRSNEPVNCGRRDVQHAHLWLRCRENTTALHITTNCHLTSGHGGYGEVLLRVDDNQSFKRDFTDSTNSRSLGLWNGRRSIGVIKRLFGGDTLRTRFTPFGENAVELSFDIEGIENAIEPLRETCNW